MIRIEWQDQTLTVRRLVFRPADWPNDGARLRSLADRTGLDTADGDHARPRAGDFWLGCQPSAGWGEPGAEIGWGHLAVLPLAVAVLERVGGQGVVRVAPDLRSGADTPHLIEQ